MRFLRQNKLTRSREFSAILGGAEFKASSPGLLFLARRNNLTFPRLGLVIGKKNVKKAVDRNQLKRIIRESFRLNLADYPSIDIVVIARKPCAQYDKPQMWEVLNILWQKLHK